MFANGIALLLALQPDRPYEGPDEVAGDPDAEVPYEEPAPPKTVEPPPKKKVAPATYVGPITASGPRPDRRPRPGSERTWVLGAFLDGGYVYNSNLPDNHINRGVFTSPRSDEFTVPFAAGYLRHDARESEPWSLELALQFGPAATALVASDPQPGGDASQLTGTTVWQHIGRANVGGRIPKAGTEIAAGLFGTPISVWSFWSKDNWSYSTPWHLNAVPYVLMAVRVLQPVGKRVVLHGWIANGYQTYADVNKVPSYMLGGIATPTDGLQIGHFDYFGPEEADIAPRAWRWLSDTWLFYEGDRFGIVSAFDVMREKLTLHDGQPVALYVAGSLAPRVKLLEAVQGKVLWHLTARGEAFWDRDGRIYGVPQLLGSASVDSDVRLWDHLLVRLEYRYDQTTARNGFFYNGAAIHDDDVGLAHDQHTLFAMLSGTFEYWFATRRKKKK